MPPISRGSRWEPRRATTLGRLLAVSMQSNRETRRYTLFSMWPLVLITSPLRRSLIRHFFPSLPRVSNSPLAREGRAKQSESRTQIDATRMEFLFVCRLHFANLCALGPQPSVD